MKAKIKPTTKGIGHHSGCVCLQLTHLSAQQICIAGSFNDWHPNVTPMIRLNEGEWAKELSLPPGRYEYRFVVDGQWVDDPTAAELIPNSYGTANAVLVVEAQEPSHTTRSVGSPTPKRQRVTKPKPSTRLES